MTRSWLFGLIAALCVTMSPMVHAQAAGDKAAGAKLTKLCDTCHTVRGPDGKPVIGELAGGKVAVPGVAGSNLTPSPSGLAKFDEKMFTQAIREAQVGSRKLKVMNPVLFRNLSDSDLHTIWAYLRQLPKVDHIVDNTKPATKCKKCGQMHGGGDMN